MPNDGRITRAPDPQATATPKVLALKELSKVYGDTVAVDGVSFDVGRNEIVGLLGPNGAGKTTIINMILGVLEPSAGSIHIEGADIAKHRSQALGSTNFTAVYAPLPGNLTVIQNLRFFGLLYGVTTTFLEDVWSRNFLNLFATRLSIAEYLAGLVISSILTSSSA